LLRNEFKQWQKMLESLDEEKISQLVIDYGWTVKDILGHLSSWQQVTLARLSAAQKDGSPDYPTWFPGEDVETDAELNSINEKIYQSRKNQLWAEVQQEWHERYETILSICETSPEADFLALGKYKWLSDYPLVTVLEGSRKHHEEHRQSLINHIS
jgi:hypothetical protein